MPARMGGAGALAGGGARRPTGAPLYTAAPLCSAPETHRGGAPHRERGGGRRDSHARRAVPRPRLAPVRAPLGLLRCCPCRPRPASRPVNPPAAPPLTRTPCSPRCATAVPAWSLQPAASSTRCTDTSTCACRRARSRRLRPAPRPPGVPAHAAHPPALPRVQMTERSGVSGEQGMVECLGLVQDVFKAVGEAMERDMAAWPVRNAVHEAKRKKQQVGAAFACLHASARMPGGRLSQHPPCCCCVAGEAGAGAARARRQDGALDADDGRGGAARPGAGARAVPLMPPAPPRLCLSLPPCTLASHPCCCCCCCLCLFSLSLLLLHVTSACKRGARGSVWSGSGGGSITPASCVPCTHQNNYPLLRLPTHPSLRVLLHQWGRGSGTPRWLGWRQRPRRWSSQVPACVLGGFVGLCTGDSPPLTRVIVPTARRGGSQRAGAGAAGPVRGNQGRE